MNNLYSEYKAVLFTFLGSLLVFSIAEKIHREIGGSSGYETLVSLVFSAILSFFVLGLFLKNIKLKNLIFSLLLSFLWVSVYGLDLASTVNEKVLVFNENTFPAVGIYIFLNIVSYFVGYIVRLVGSYLSVRTRIIVVSVLLIGMIGLIIGYYSNIGWIDSYIF